MATIGHNHLEGQRALVTGATSGIGGAVALQLAGEGPMFWLTAATPHAAPQRSQRSPPQVARPASLLPISATSPTCSVSRSRSATSTS